MDQNNRATVPSEIASLGGKSWTAYVLVVLVGVVLAFFITPLVWVHGSATAGVVVLAATFVFMVYHFLHIKSFHLFFDDVGVWVYSGILPWNKGVTGVQWRDIDEAVYFQSMGSWLFKSYSIRIGHRFTKSGQILLSHWTRGHEAVMAINMKHQNMVRAGALS